MKPLVLLLLFTTTSLSQQLDYPDSSAGSTDDPWQGIPGVDLLRQWIDLKAQVDSASIDSFDSKCTSSIEETFAQFTLGDLLSNHQIDGIIQWALMHKKFYQNYFPKLSSALGATPKRVFCSYDGKLICHSDRCVSCSPSPPDDAADWLRRACSFNGKGGIDAQNITVDETQLPSRKDVELPERQRKDGECVDGWLNLTVAQEFLKTLEENQDQMETFAECTTAANLRDAWNHLNWYVNGVSQGRNVSWNYWEEQLWPFKAGNSGDWHFCSRQKKTVNGPWVCGSDGRCVDCKIVEDLPEKHEENKLRFADLCKEARDPHGGKWEEDNNAHCYWHPNATTSTLPPVTTANSPPKLGTNLNVYVIALPIVALTSTSL